jgi:hypothetical protein
MKILNEDIELGWVYPTPLLGESIFIVVHDKEYSVISTWNAYDAIICTRVTSTITRWKEFVENNINEFRVYNLKGGEIDLEKAYKEYNSNPECWTIDYDNKFRRR